MRSNRGKLYWKPGQVRVLLTNGRLIDLGNRPLEASRAVAAKFGLELIRTDAGTSAKQGRP